MRKILYLIESDDPGGAEKVVLALVEYFKHKYPIVIGCLRRGWIYDQLIAKGFNPKVIPTNNGPVDLKLLCHLIQLIKRERVGLIHSHLFDINFYSSIAAKITGIPHLCTEHGDIHHPSKTSKKNLIKARILSICSHKVIFVCRYTKTVFCKISNISKGKSAIIYNGIKLDNFHKSIDVKKKKIELGLRHEDIVIGNVGSLYPVKGQIYLLKAAKIVLQKFPNVKFIIVGAGKLENKLKEEAKNLNIADHMLFLGFREDTHELLKVMDIFVLSSISEGFPLSLIEAMAAGLPVVATDVGGIREVYELGADIRLVKAEDPHALAQAIKGLIRDRNFKSQRNHELACRYFSVENMVKNYVTLYDSLLPTTK